MKKLAQNRDADDTDSSSKQQLPKDLLIYTPTNESGRGTRLRRWRLLVLPMMAGAATLYLMLQLFMQTPALRRVIAVLIGGRSGPFEPLWNDPLVPQRLATSAAATLAIVLAFFAAWVLTARTRCQSYEKPLVFGLVAYALITVPAAIIGGVGSVLGATPLQPPSGPLLVALAAAGILAYSFWTGRKPVPAGRAGQRLQTLPIALISLAAALLAVSMTISLAHPPTGYDALSYHAPMAVYLWRYGNLDALLIHGWVFAHPGAAELWFGLLLLAGGEAMANLGQLPLAILGALAVRAFGKRIGLGDGAAFLGATAFLLIPIVAMQAGMQLNDVTAAALVMAAIALAAARPESWTPSRFALVGLALGLSAATKLAVLPSIAGLFLFLVLTLRRHGATIPRRTALRGMLLLAVVMGIVLAPWWTRNIVHYGNPIFPVTLPVPGGAALAGRVEPPKDSEFVPSRLAWPLYPLIEWHGDQSGFGTLFAVAVLPGLAFVILRRRNLPLLLYGAVAVPTLLAWWLFSRHEPRLMLAVVGIGCAYAGYSLVAVPRRWRQGAGAVVLSAASLSVLMTLSQAVLPLARQPSTRAEFYDEAWGIDPIIWTLPDSTGVLYHMGFAKLSYAGDYPLLGRDLQRTILTFGGTTPAPALAERMQNAGIRYAYVPAAPEFQPRVESQYDTAWFDLEHVSIVREGDRSGTRRYLFRLRQPPSGGTPSSTATTPYAQVWFPWTKP